ncbi:MAG: hypothetical protein ABI147_00725 [Acidobacteriaceae bacterium]
MSDKLETSDDMLSEYDFSKGVRGKYASHFKDVERLVSLDPDVKAVFPDSEAVNAALRVLIKAAHDARLAVEFSKAS